MKPRKQTKICQLCGKNVKKGYNHHYLTRKLDETKTFFVCPRCHQLDHHLIDQLKWQIDNGYIQPDLNGKDPYADRRAAIKAAQERIGSQKHLLP
jgi:phosphatidylserine/phosphatidylglycerophosphate/cardiolipin synthase-like enzyme